MYFEEWLLRIPVVGILILIGNVVLSKVPTIGCILKSIGFLIIAILLKGIDIFSEALIITSSIIGVTLAFYTYAYSKTKYGSLGLAPLVDLFLFSMVILFRAKTFIEFITFWLLTELIAFFLIAYDYIVKEDVQPLRASIKYLVFSMIPTDLALFILLAVIGFEEAFTTPLTMLNLNLVNPVVLSLIILGFFSKAAIIPLHFWLPDAHSVAPSPASALLSGLMVKMGIYALYLISLQSLEKSIALIMLILFGGLTAIYGAAQASIQQDVKRLLAYSTTSETGILAIVLGLYILSGDSLFIVSSTVYSVAHALYKSFMFMDSGYIEVTSHTRNINELGFIHRLSSLQSTSVLMSIMSYLGMPPSAGFLGKLTLFIMISKYLTYSYVYSLALAIAMLKVIISVIYNAVYLKAHFGKELPAEKALGHILPREGSTLTITCFISSVYPYIITIPLIMLTTYSEATFIGIKALETVYYITLASLAISLALYPLIYVVVKRRGS